MTITIHQPEHLVWLGFLDKILKSDIFVVLDGVQFKKNNFQNRNRIRTADGWRWITVPVKGHSLSTPIKDIEISEVSDWRRSYLDILKSSYKRADFFQPYYRTIEKILLKRHKLLADLNFELLMEFLNFFGIEKKVLKSSEMGLPETLKSSDLLIKICQDLSGDTYLAGAGAHEYIEEGKFSEAGIKLEFQEFQHPVYKQVFDPFVPGMSSVDLLFNHGPKAKEILLGR